MQHNSKNGNNSPEQPPVPSQPYYHPKLTEEQKHRLFSQAARVMQHERTQTPVNDEPPTIVAVSTSNPALGNACEELGEAAINFGAKAKESE